MKWLIASDIHGAAASCARLLEAYQREGADRLLLLGDLLESGSMEDKEAIAASLNAMADHITAVAGNCDSSAHRHMLAFDLDDYASIPGPGGRTVFATHGKIYNESSWPPGMERGDILLVGHTHVPASVRYPTLLSFNPGSVGKPRGGSPRSYMTWEGSLFIWKTLSGQEFRRYEVEPK